MATYYIDWEGGDDSKDGTSFANRKKTPVSLQGTSMTGGDEVRYAGKPRQLVDSSAKIWNWMGAQGYSSPQLNTITYSTTTGNTNIYFPGHGLQTGETISIDRNNNFSNPQDNLNGIWEVTRVDADNFKLNDYTGPSGQNGTSGSGGYWRSMKTSVIQLSSELTQEIASNGQRSGPWTASTNVTCTLETSTGTWSDHFPSQSCVYSDKIEIADGFGTGKAAYWPIGSSLNLSGYQQISYLIRQTSGTRTTAGTGSTTTPSNSLRLCTDTGGDTSVHTIPLITGQDTDKSWRDFTHDFGTNLNSGIQSIALYVDVDNGAQTFNFDNIIACKAKSAANSLTLNSIVGLGTQPNCPQYYKIGSIRKKNIRLLLNDRYYTRYPYGYYSPGGVSWEGAVGVARTSHPGTTVNLYKIEPSQMWEDCKILPCASSWGSFSPDHFYLSSKSGISTTNRIKFTGGWDTSNSMASQHTGGFSALNGQNSYGYMLKWSSCNYAEYENFIGCSAMNPIQWSSCSYSKFMNIGATGSGYYGIQMSSCSYIMGGAYMWSMLGQYAFYMNSCSNWDNYKDQNVGMTTFFSGPSMGSAYYWSSNSNNTITKMRGINNATGNCLYIESCNNTRFEEVTIEALKGGTYPVAFRIGNSSGCTVGILTVKNSYYGTQFQNSPDIVVDKFDFLEEDYTRANGSNGYQQNQYPTYNQSNAVAKYLGGTWSRMPYLYGSDVYTNNIVFEATNDPNFQQSNRLLCKNFDGNTSGEFKNYYRYGNVLPDTSTRHTASGFSWKIDISSSNATEGVPVEWELGKIICNANAQVTASIWVYRDGTGVNGGIRVKANALGGITSQVTANITDTTVNSWVQCSMNFTPNEAGTVSIYAIGYYSTTGGNTSHNVWLDDFTVTQA